MKDWVGEVRHVHTVTIDHNQTVHANPGCRHISRPHHMAILWRNRTITLRPGLPAIIDHDPTVCPHCDGWAPDIDDWTKWRDWAACRNMGWELFFPEDGAQGQVGDPRVATAMCAKCPVATWCLRTALRQQRHNYFDFGIWGGFDVGARTRLRLLLRDWVRD